MEAPKLELGQSVCDSCGFAYWRDDDGADEDSCAECNEYIAEVRTTERRETLLRVARELREEARRLTSAADKESREDLWGASGRVAELRAQASCAIRMAVTYEREARGM